MAQFLVALGEGLRLQRTNRVGPENVATARVRAVGPYRE